MKLPKIALSIRQPWAWAIIHAGKDIENRSTAALRHGMEPRRIAIHAAKGMTRAEYASADEFMASIDVSCPKPDVLIRGAIIGAVTVTDVVAAHPSPWFFGPRGLVLTDAIAVDPIPASGALGYFKWSEAGEIDAPAKWMKTWPDWQFVSTPTTNGPDLFEKLCQKSGSK